MHPETFSTLSDGGEMGALMRALDWSKTAVGPVEKWPQSLKTAVRIILTSRYAMFVWWGRELVNIYNDPYRAFLGVKHPAALGKSARDVWAEIWDQIGPRTDAVLLRGESTYDEALLLLMERHGYLEETYFTFSYSPLLDDDGKIGGLFCAVTEATEQVIGERRLRLLREVAEATAEARTPEQVCTAAAECLSHARRDLPFSLIYLLDGNGVKLRRAAQTGIGVGHSAAPDIVELRNESFWPFQQVLDTGEAVIVDLDARLTDLPSGEWEKRPVSAVLMPITQQGQKRPAGVFVAGINPHRQFTDEYRGFVSVLANQIAGGIAKQKIEASEARLRLAQAAAQIGTWEWDPTHGISRLSPELHETFGTDANDSDHAAVWASRVYRDDRDAVSAKMEAGYRDGKMEFEYRYEHPKNGVRWLYCKGSRLESETRMFGIVLDITERKQTEDHLEKALVASRRLAAIVESSDDAIASKNLNGIVTSWNPAAERIFGYSADEMVGQSILKVIPPELHSDEDRILATIARGDRIEHFETVRLRKDGTRIDVSLTVSPVRDESGRIVGAAKIARDITQRKKAEQALRTTERLASVGRLAATVAHEINNPLEAVTNLVYLARTSAAKKEIREYLQVAEDELGRISHLTKQTLGFYRETRGASAIEVGTLVAPLVTVFSSRAKNKGVELRQEIREHGQIQAVPGEIRRVLANLISNSIDATNKGGVVRIRVAGRQRPRDGVRGVTISVADTGAGISKDIRAHLFEPFFTTKKDVGTGLGLWVCKNIVENHGGDIRVRSCTTPGKSGTVFSVFLPENAQPVEQDFRRAG